MLNKLKCYLKRKYISHRLPENMRLIHVNETTQDSLRFLENKVD